MNAERFGEYTVSALDTKSFNNLPLKTKRLIMHLHKAGLHGRDIAFDQNYRNNLQIKNLLETIQESIIDNVEVDQEFKESFEHYIKEFWFHVGIHNSRTEEKIKPLFTRPALETVIMAIEERDPSAFYKIDNVNSLIEIITEPQVDRFRKNPASESELSESNVNFYGSGVTKTDVEEYASKLYKINTISRFPSLSLDDRKINHLSDHEIEAISLFISALGDCKIETCESLNDGEKETALRHQVIIKMSEKLNEAGPELRKALHSFSIQMKEIINSGKLTSLFRNATSILSEQPQHLLNGFVYKDSSGKLVERKWNNSDVYKFQITKIIEELTLALEFTENDEQLESLKSLIAYYKTGCVKDFDQHCIKWTQDINSKVYFVNGFIESYTDPLGFKGMYESIIAIVDEDKTKRISLLSEHAQAYEDQMPFDKEFRKKNASGLSAIGAHVISMAGDVSPGLPMGINLPNSGWIRKKIGSKSVVFTNLGGGSSSVDKEEVEEFFSGSDMQTLITKHQKNTSDLQTDLHEVIGHGSGQILAGVSENSLGEYYSIIEETRADLNSLYHMDSELTKQLGLINSDDEILAQYQYYVTNGMQLQFKRVKQGDPITQTHMRNRLLISQWAIKMSEQDFKENQVCGLKRVVIDNKTHFIVTSTSRLKEYFGMMLCKIQEIISTGNKTSAQNIIGMYGTHFDRVLHMETLERFAKLNCVLFRGFTPPKMEVRLDSTKAIDDIVCISHSSFTEAELENSRLYSN